MTSKAEEPRRKQWQQRRRRHTGQLQPVPRFVRGWCAHVSRRGGLRCAAKTGYPNCGERREKVRFQCRLEITAEGGVKPVGMRPAPRDLLARDMRVQRWASI